METKTKQSSSAGLVLSWQRYKRPFRKPFKAAWGKWTNREGFVLSLTDQQTKRSGFGEAAVLPQFGSETYAEAESYLAGIPNTSTVSNLTIQISQAPPAAAFALESALADLQSDPRPRPKARSAILFSSLSKASRELPVFRDQGFSTFKVKLGMTDPETEWAQLGALADHIRNTEKLRLDPNQSWNLKDWEYWSPRLWELAIIIEFIEEPFKAGACSPERLMEIATEAPVPLALDESLSASGGLAVANWQSLGWPGYWIIKPSLLGSTSNWLSLLESHKHKTIISSVFETGIGMSHLVRLAQQFPDTDHGLGTQSGFDDSFGVPHAGPRVSALSLQQKNTLWNQLPNP